MPLTAYSHQFAAELDLPQWMSRVSGIPLDRIQTSAIPEHFRDYARSDLICPSCSAQGATLVGDAHSKGTRRKIRQATVRFNSPDGGNAHDPLCDFAHSDEGTGGRWRVDLQTPKDAVTREIRRLVCAGIHSGAFTQADMQAMRMWFLNQRRRSQFTVTLDPSVPAFIEALRRWKWHAPSVEFSPSHGDIPGCNWRLAAAGTVVARYLPRLDEIRERRPIGMDMTSAENLARRLRGETTFDASVLHVEFSLAHSLLDFIACHHRIFSSKRHSTTRGGLLTDPAPLLAFAALLLFVSKWDIGVAIERFVRLVQISAPGQVPGNLIGLNPFADIRAIEWIKVLQDEWQPSNPPMSFDEEIDHQEQILRRTYELWVARGRPAL